MAICSRCSRSFDDRLPSCPSCAADDQTAFRPDAPPRKRDRIDATFTPGTILCGRYRILSRLGHGAMGEVYRAKDEELDEDVALKFLPDSLRNGTTIELLRNEVRLARTIAHPNVCRVFDIGSADGSYFLSMELVDGEDLSALLRRAGRLSAEKVAEITLQLCDGLEAAHRIGVIHRDLKPANVLIDRAGGIRISDFGLACECDDEFWREVICGTPAYMAPERLSGGPASVGSDLFALGVTVREMLTGSIDGAWPSHTDAIAHHLSGLALHCMRTDPAERPRSAAEAAASLRRALSSGDDALAAARNAASRQQWRTALDAFSKLPQDELGPDDLEIFAEAALLLGDLEKCIAVRERAYAAWMHQNDRERAARVALRLVADYGNRLAPAVANGWLAKAERLLRNIPEGAAHGWLARTRAAEAFGRRDYESALAEGLRCEAIGAQCGDRDLEAIGLHEQGRALLKSGAVEKGWALLDEAAAVAVSGEISAYATGVIFCNVLASCRAAADYDRAAAWSEAAKRWCERQSLTGFPGVCRVYRAEIMRLRGRWTEAQDEVLRAATELEKFSPAITRSAFYELGEIRRRTGDLSGAEQAYRMAQELGLDPEPGMSLLKLRRGNVDAARASLRRAIDESGGDALDRDRLLAAMVEVAVKDGDIDTARGAAEEIDRIAASYSSAALRATAAHSRGLVAHAEGRFAEARQFFRTANSLWVDIDAPYERAQAQLRTAEAHLAANEADAAAQSAASALATFDRLGASLDSADARRVIDLAQRSS